LLDLEPGNGGGGAGGTAQGGGGSGGNSCQPSIETCNGFDDDCDGQVDEGCSCTNGETQTCYSGPAETVDVGPCKQGSQLCDGGQWTACAGETLPVFESCDAVDNDCDGTVDDGNPDGGNPCNAGLPGLCGQGMTKCQNGNFVCGQVNFPKPEQCDGIDNNCNLEIDEGNPGGGAACLTGAPGVCAQGAVACLDGQLVCAPDVMPSAETCDGLDNDCNGAVDDGNPEGGMMCATGQAGECAAGVTSCAGGAVKCNPVKPPSSEVCDGLDNDCNGAVDDVPGLGNTCQTGAPPPCNAGKFACQSGALVCVASVNASPETCDGVDNNCNGQVDEGNPGGGAACMTGAPGVCGPGTLTCQAGMLSCLANVAMGGELCAAPGDEDCDGSAATVFFSETFASNAAAWQLDTEWQIGAAKTSMGQSYGNPDPGFDHTATDDNGVAGVVIGGNAATNMQHPTRWLTSPFIVVDPAATTVYLQFWRWLNSDFSPWMTNRVEVFDTVSNTWKAVWQSGSNPGVQDSAWTKLSYNITNASKGGSIRVRFGFNIGAGGPFTVSQWNVDDVVITTEPCD